MVFPHCVGRRHRFIGRNLDFRYKKLHQEAFTYFVFVFTRLASTGSGAGKRSGKPLAIHLARYLMW